MNVEETDRDRKARIVNDYFRCVIEGRLQDLPITTDYGSESPLSGLVNGTKAITHLGSIGTEMTDIRVIQNIVEGDFVATYFEEVTHKGVLPVVGLFEFSGDKIKFVRVFFDSAHLGA
jgi:hypothetical protein